MMKAYPKDTLNRLLIAMAVNSLCQEMGLNDITVDLVCEKSGLSRSTFYRSFNDKYEIPLWAQRYALGAGFGQIGRTLTCIEGNTVVGKGLIMFKSLIRESILTGGVNTPDKVGMKQHADYMTSTLKECKHVEIDKELQIQILYTASGSAAIARMWIMGEIDETEGGLAKFLDSCYPARLHSLINDPVDPKPACETDMFDVRSLMIFASES